MGLMIYPAAWVLFGDYFLHGFGGFEDLLAWIISGSNTYCECMFDYILQPCLGQMASIMQGRPTGFWRLCILLD